MKLLHTADIQLGAQFKGLGERAEAQREQIKKTFHRALELAIEEKVGLILIAGDLFDSNHPSLELTQFARGEFRFLKDRGVKVCIVPGHHDALDEHGIYNRERFDEEFSNVFIFRDPQGGVKEYEDLDIAIFAKPNAQSTSTKSPFPGLAGLTTSMKYKVVAAHGELMIPGKFAGNYHPIAISELEGLTGIDYAALGHWHSMQDCTTYGKFKMPVWYAGSPELVALDQAGAGNVLVGEFSNQGVKILPKRVGRRMALTLQLDIANFNTIEELKEKIFEQQDQDAICRVELSGIDMNNVTVNLERLETDLADAFFFVKITDNTHVRLEDLPQYPDKLIQGQFVKIMREKIKGLKDDAEKKICEEALQMGLMELEGKEVV